MDEQILNKIKETAGEEVFNQVQSSISEMQNKLSEVETLKQKLNELSQEKEKLKSHSESLLNEKKSEKQKRDEALSKLTEKDETLKALLDKVQSTENELSKFKIENRNSKFKEGILSVAGSKVIDGALNDVVKGIFDSTQWDDDGKPYLINGGNKVSDVTQIVSTYLEQKPFYLASKQKEGAGTSTGAGNANSDLDALKKQYERLSTSHNIGERAQALTIKRQLAKQGVQL